MEKISVPEFDWARIGDIASGRENLGELLPVAVYRLMQFTVFDVMEAEFGKEAAQGLFRKAGFSAGMAFAKNNLDLGADFNAFVSQLQNVLKALLIGILKIESANADKTKISLSVSEDLDCSGLSDIGETVCYYDEGFLAGVLKAYTGLDYDVVEVDCWASGGRTCRFTAEIN
ncbi:MAG: 4-vinyl reductase [Firmicutes bacterium]|nr:4-vinyl reductase [Bacillota bacterium]